MIDAQFRFNQCNSFREEYISVFSPYGSAGYVDLDMLNMFAVSTYHLSLIVFEIKDEQY